MTNHTHTIKKLRNRYRRAQFYLTVPLMLCVTIWVVLASQMGNGTGLDTDTWPLMELRNANLVAGPNGTDTDFNKVAKASGDHSHSPESIASIILAATWTLLFANTWLFAIEIFSFASHNNDGETEGDRRAKLSSWLRWVAMAITIVLIICLVAWGFTLVLLTTNLTTHKYIGLGFFGIFFVLDIILAHSFRSTHATKVNSLSVTTSADYEIVSSDLKRSQQYYSNQAWVVDFPIIIATVLSLLLSTWIKGISGDLSFVKGLYSGGWIVHLAMSQIVFLIVSFRVGHSRKRDLDKALLSLSTEKKGIGRSSIAE